MTGHKSLINLPHRDLSWFWRSDIHPDRVFDLHRLLDALGLKTHQLMLHS